MRQYGHMAKSSRTDLRRSHRAISPKQPDVVRQESVFHHGPLPSPDTLRGYDDLVPGAASIIIKMATDQAAHRQALEREAQESDVLARNKTLDIEDARIRGTIINERIGMFCGWVVAAGCVGGAIWSAVNDKPWPLIAVFLSLPVASIIRAFSGKT